MEKILAELNQKFSGQAAARLDTYAGKMDVLKVSAANASEIIGKGLLDSLQVLAKDNSIENAGTAMEDFATDIANATYGMALLIAKTKEFLNLPGKSQNLGGPLSFIPIIGPLLETVAKYGATEIAKPKSNFTYDLGASATKDIERANAIIKGNKARATELKLLKEKNALEALKIKYDVERAGLMLALNQATDEETRVRIAEKLAILDGNAAKAQQYLADTELTFQTNQLAKSISNAGLAAESFSKFAMGAVQRGEYADAYKNISNVPSGGGGVGGRAIPTPSFNMGAVQRGEYITVNNQFAGSMVTDQDMTNLITDTILRINKMGRGTTPAGGLSGGT
jgi:hypothetical protein